ncbi:hypothetical protein [Bosea sp. (in: a-proteobacteria)]|uniref:hypothetical protein n=1 Tax=Bosea sp. (in: a-proteobacteria) TaxID=1871050 RepID=UPI002615EB6C|nr:hypothetical protein [Bosea sp. (in: a-proteobacteria)]MCO5089412.1 hypothetical protein [Bosea sp. (in: a-proteobacteria)]
MDEERITRIARAMCRAARIDPDKPAGDGDPAAAAMREPGQGEAQPAWMLFRREAMLFALRHHDVAIRL